MPTASLADDGSGRSGRSGHGVAEEGCNRQTHDVEVCSHRVAVDLRVDTRQINIGAHHVDTHSVQTNALVEGTDVVHLVHRDGTDERVVQDAT